MRAALGAARALQPPPRPLRLARRGETARRVSLQRIAPAPSVQIDDGHQSRDLPSLAWPSQLTSHPAHAHTTCVAFLRLEYGGSGSCGWEPLGTRSACCSRAGL